MKSMKITLSDAEEARLASLMLELGLSSYQGLLRHLIEQTAVSTGALKRILGRPEPEAEPEAGIVIVHPSAVRTYNATRPEDWVYPEQVELWSRLLLPMGDIIPPTYIRGFPIAAHHVSEVDRLFLEQGWADAGFALVWSEPVRKTCSGPGRRGQPWFPGDRIGVVTLVEDQLGAALSFLNDSKQPLAPLMLDSDLLLDAPPHVRKIVGQIHDMYDRLYTVTYLESLVRIRYELKPM